jgi:hypothetical protein
MIYRPKPHKPYKPHVLNIFNILSIFFKHILKNPVSPFGKLADYWYRVELQHRGSLYVHVLPWIENARLRSSWSARHHQGTFVTSSCCSASSRLFRPLLPSLTLFPGERGFTAIAVCLVSSLISD